MKNVAVSCSCSRADGMKCCWSCGWWWWSALRWRGVVWVVVVGCGVCWCGGVWPGHTVRGRFLRITTPPNFVTALCWLLLCKRWTTFCLGSNAVPLFWSIKWALSSLVGFQFFLISGAGSQQELKNVLQYFSHYCSYLLLESWKCLSPPPMDGTMPYTLHGMDGTRCPRQQQPFDASCRYAVAGAPPARWICPILFASCWMKSRKTKTPARWIYLILKSSLTLTCRPITRWNLAFKVQTHYFVLSGISM